MKLISETCSIKEQKATEARLKKAGYFITKWHIKKGMCTPEVREIKKWKKK